MTLIIILFYMLLCHFTLNNLFYAVMQYYLSSTHDWQRSAWNENTYFRNHTDGELDFDGENEYPQVRLATNPMCRTFPRIASCDYHRFGGGGKDASINAICILALNVVNDKVFFLVWLWLLMLAISGRVTKH